MTWRTLLAGLAAIAVACGGEETAGGPEATTLVSQEGGLPHTPAWSSDGSRIAYAKPVDGQAAIHVAAADGSDPVRLTEGIWDYNPRWSPDDRWIAYHAEAPLYDVWVVPSDGGPARPLTSGPEIDQPREWLPDGSGVVFNRYGAGDVRTLVASLDGDSVYPLVPPLEGNQFVTVSPDGRRVAFDLHRGGEGTIWVQDRDGGEPRQLTTEGLERALTPHMWSPDGRSLVYTSRRTGTWDLWIADVESGETRQLTTDVRNDEDPHWSPDGEWIVFTSDRGGQSDVWIVRTDPEAERPPVRVTNDGADELEPLWSPQPDADRILFPKVASTFELHARPADGGAPRVLVSFEDAYIEDLTLSPDGGLALFTSSRSGNEDIWAVPLGGGPVTPFVASPLDDEQARWSPDGSRVAFRSTRGGSGDLWVVDAAGGSPRRLTDWPSNEGSPRWSPDGSTLAFLSDRDASVEEVWTLSVDGGQATRLTHTNVAADAPMWTPDGAAVLFAGSTPTGARELYRVPAEGGTPVPLGADPTLGNADVSPSGDHVAYTAFAGGMGYVEVLPVEGGEPRRLTPGERVFQPLARWSSTGDRLAVMDYDYPSDTHDLKLVTWPGGEWTDLTETPDANEGGPVWTPDGETVVYVQNVMRGSIVSVDVGPLLEDGGR